MNSPQEQQNPAGGPGFAGKLESDKCNPLVPQVPGRVKGNPDNLTGQLGEFRAVLHAHGLTPGDIIPDGQLHRCGTSGKERGQDGTYVFHPDSPASGWYQNYRTDDKGTWTAKAEAHWTQEERAAQKARIERDRVARQAEEARRHAEARERAKAIYEACNPCPADHPYLVEKGVAPVDGLRQTQDGRLVAPGLDAHGQTQTLQYIGTDGAKRFLYDGQAAGAYFAIKATGGAKDGPLYIVEGLATGLTVHAAMGETVLVAFNAGNLMAVAAMARVKYPDREIILVADNDHKTEGNPGFTKATEAARAIKGKLAVPHFADPAGKSDFNDLATAEGMEAVKAQLAEAREPEVEAVKVLGLVALDAAQFLNMTFPPREYVLSPVIPTQGLAMLYAPRGVGKTYMAMTIAYAVASGQRALRWFAPKARPVLYVDGEMPAVSMRERLAQIVAGFGQEEILEGYLQIVTPDLQPDFMPNLATPEGQARIAPILDGTALVVVDNIATLARHGRENETEGWLPVQAWILDLRRRGISVLLVHHANKSGGQRGTSAREDVLDTVISLRRPADYREEEGARFEVHLEKARGIVGQDAKPFEATLIQEGPGLVWKTRDIEDVEAGQVARLHAEGNSVRDIAEETGISKSTVQRIIKRIKGAA
jgi:putative DNA primase/helicase